MLLSTSSFNRELVSPIKAERSKASTALQGLNRLFLGCSALGPSLFHLFRNSLLLLGGHLPAFASTFWRSFALVLRLRRSPSTPDTSIAHPAAQLVNLRLDLALLFFQIFQC